MELPSSDVSAAAVPAVLPLAAAGGQVGGAVLPGRHEPGL